MLRPGHTLLVVCLFLVLASPTPVVWLATGSLPVESGREDPSPEGPVQSKEESTQGKIGTPGAFPVWLRLLRRPDLSSARWTLSGRRLSTCPSVRPSGAGHFLACGRSIHCRLQLQIC
jgi:hypothetical protein